MKLRTEPCVSKRCAASEPSCECQNRLVYHRNAPLHAPPPLSQATRRVFQVSFPCPPTSAAGLPIVLPIFPQLLDRYRRIRPNHRPQGQIRYNPPSHPPRCPLCPDPPSSMPTPIHFSARRCSHSNPRGTTPMLRHVESRMGAFKPYYIIDILRVCDR